MRRSSKGRLHSHGNIYGTILPRKPQPPSSLFHSNTDSDCPEPCACYAAGKDKAYFEVRASLDGPEGCACQPCQVKRACLQKVMALMAKSSPGLFDLVEVWALEDHTN